MKLLPITGLLLLLVSHIVQADYGYTIKNPIVATIVGTPEELRITQDDIRHLQPDYVKIVLPDSQFERPIEESHKITLFPERNIPDVFWYERGGLRYSVAKHRSRAPLIFIIAGTGASYQSSTVKNLQKIFYQVGYHVIALSSPTVPNFMYNASTSVMPGNLEEDSLDLYHVMQSIITRHRDIEVSDYYLIGYSLGGSHAAFIARLDDKKGNSQQQHFQFKKVLLINPPFSLVSSVDVLDNMFENNIPGGINNFNTFFDKFIRKASDFYSENEELGLGRDFFYEIFKQQPPSDEEMKAMVGFVFRISSAGMIFGVDVFNQKGYIVPKSRVSELGPGTSLTHFAKIAHRLGFNDYIKHLYIPNFEQKTGKTAQQLIEQSSLEYLRDYLQGRNHIHLMHNADDPILSAGDIDRFKALFPGRSIIYPHGGHLGNMQYKQNVLDMLMIMGKSEVVSVSDVQ